MAAVVHDTRTNGYEAAPWQDECLLAKAVELASHAEKMGYRALRLESSGGGVRIEFGELGSERAMSAPIA